VEERIKNEWSYSNGDGEVPDEIEGDVEKASQDKDVVDEVLELQD